MRVPLKRHYKTVSLSPVAGDATRFLFLLDGKPVKTPGGRELAIPDRRLAESVALEWQEQGEKVDPAGMPLTRLAMSLIDQVAPRMVEVRREALGYAASDLLCYRADQPERLVARQTEKWQPYLDWAARTLDAKLTARAGLMAIDQDAQALSALEAAVATLDAGRLLVLQALTMRLGSLVLALAVIGGHATTAEALAASRLDEDFQAEIWGRDAEAEARAARIASEVENLGRFLALLG